MKLGKFDCRELVVGVETPFVLERERSTGVQFDLGWRAVTWADHEILICFASGNECLHGWQFPWDYLAEEGIDLGGEFLSKLL